jgi:hypothetical protein
MAKRQTSGHDRPKAAANDGPQDGAQDEDLDQLAPKGPQGGSSGAVRKGILIRVQPQGWKALRHLAIEKSMDAGRTVTLQEVMLEAINDYLQKHGKPPVA